MALDVDDPEVKLLKKIENKQNELNVLKNKLCSLREMKKLKSKDQKILNNAMKSLQRLHENQSQIGLNQIENIATYNKVSSTDLEDLCRENEMNILKWYESGGKNYDNKRVLF